MKIHIIKRLKKEQKQQQFKHSNAKTNKVIFERSLVMTWRDIIVGRESFPIMPLPLIIVARIFLIRLRGFDSAIVSIIDVMPFRDGPHRGRVVAIVVIMVVVHMC